MYSCFDLQSQGRFDPSSPAAAGGRADWGFPPQGPPLPVNVLAVVASFLIFKPLGLAAPLCFWLSARRQGISTRASLAGAATSPYPVTARSRNGDAKC